MFSCFACGTDSLTTKLLKKSLKNVKPKTKKALTEQQALQLAAQPQGAAKVKPGGLCNPKIIVALPCASESFFVKLAFSPLAFQTKYFVVFASAVVGVLIKIMMNRDMNHLGYGIQNSICSACPFCACPSACCTAQCLNAQLGIAICDITSVNLDISVCLGFLAEQQRTATCLLFFTPYRPAIATS